MNKKAGILTFHCVPNYGAVLQAYGLQEVLKKYFSTVEIVDYRPKSILQEYKTINFYSIFSTAATLWSAPDFLQKKRKFNHFMERYFSLSEMRGSTASDFNGYCVDVLFLGSDQIWNPDITKGFDPMYFGAAQFDIPPKLVSYAASMGRAQFQEDEIRQLRILLDGISLMSVREPETHSLLETKLSQKAMVTVDPTILAGAECFQLFIHPVREQNYLLFYGLNGYAETQALAEKTANYLGLQLVELSGRRKPPIAPPHKAIYDAGPEDFISYLANADYIVTDSFHGTAFSILFHKPVITVPHKTRGGRLESLMHLAGLERRLTARFDRSIVQNQPDWGAVDGRLSIARQKSVQFVEEAV